MSGNEFSILLKVTFDYLFYYSNFCEQFPMKALFNRRPGSLMGDWEINYRFGQAGQQEYLDCFAYRRHTGHYIIRIYDNGTYDLLAAEDKLDGFLQFARLNNNEHAFENIFEMANAMHLTHNPLPNLRRNDLTGR